MSKDLFTKQKEGMGSGAVITSTTAAGATIGTMIAPGIGTAIGAIAGAVLGGAGVITHEVNKKK